jgi:predicted HTH domain antitoxin
MANHLGGAKPGRGTTVGKGSMGALGGNTDKKGPPEGGPRARNLKKTQDFKKTEEGKAAIEKGLRRALAGEGLSDVSKYDAKTAKAIQDVDFRNSVIGRSLLADQFKQGLISATDFARLQDIQQNPVDRSLAERRQINQLLGLNPTSGMGILDSLRSGFQGEQFQQDKKRLGQLARLSPVRQAISSLFGLKPDADPTTAQMLGISPAEDARLRLFSNPDLQNIQFDNLLDDFDDTAPEQIIDTRPSGIGVSPEVSTQVDETNPLVGPAIGAGILGSALAARSFTGPPRDVRFKPTVRGLPGIVGSGSAYTTAAKEVAKSPGIFSRFISPLAKPLAALSSLPVSTAAFALAPTELAAGDFPIDPNTGLPDYSGVDLFN